MFDYFAQSMARERAGIIQVIESGSMGQSLGTSSERERVSSHIVLYLAIVFSVDEILR